VIATSGSDEESAVALGCRRCFISRFVGFCWHKPKDTARELRLMDAPSLIDIFELYPA
jgi:hypothetical protein